MTRPTFSNDILEDLLGTLHNHGVSDSELARLCKIDRRMIARWREGENIPRDFDRTFLLLSGAASVWLNLPIGEQFTPQRGDVQPAGEPSVADNPIQTLIEAFEEVGRDGVTLPESSEAPDNSIQALIQAFEEVARDGIEHPEPQ